MKPPLSSVQTRPSQEGLSKDSDRNHTVGISEQLFDELRDAWVAWDYRPREPVVAERLINLVADVAGALGVSPVVLRAWMAQRRCAGLTVGQVVDEISTGAGQAVRPFAAKGTSQRVAGQGDPAAPVEPIPHPTCGNCTAGRHGHCRPDWACQCRLDGHPMSEVA